MPMCARQPSASPPTGGGGSTDERNNNPPAQAHASPFWRVVLREPSAVRARGQRMTAVPVAMAASMPLSVPAVK